MKKCKDKANCMTYLAPSMVFPGVPAINHLIIT